MNKILKHLLQRDGNIKYYQLNNGAGKTWLLPRKNMETALGLYQPVSVKGKLIKKCMPLFATIDLVIRSLHIPVVYYDIDEKFVELMEKIFQEQNLEYTFFLGTPGVHQKITIQISKEEKIFGYCKITDSVTIAKMFEAEKETLNWLYKKGIYYIPRCLYCGTYKDDVQMFVQTTMKTLDSTIPDKLKKEHVDFLNDIYRKTKCTCSYYESDFYKTMQSFEKELTYYTQETHEKNNQKILDFVKEQISKTEEFSFFHGDFTMWNTLIAEGNLYAFDFEYAERTYPPMLDIFHLFTQKELYLKKKNAIEIFIEFEKNFVNGKYANLFSNPHLQYTYYLVHIINFYLSRDKDKFSEDIICNLKTWYLLLEMNIKKCIAETEKGRNL